MKRWLRFPRHASLVRATALALLFVAAAPAVAGDGKRLALVVGNARYEAVYSLRNPVNDSHAVADTLEQLGFEVVSIDNAGRQEFQAALDKFSEMAEGAEATVFYFSGHGFQLKGTNYLVPTDARLTSTAAIEKETLRLDTIISELQSRNRQTLIFLDACRNNPLPEDMRDKEAEAGLAEVETGSGTFVAFATAPGNITRDGTGQNSPFTSALVEHLVTPGISISDMMIRVRNEVEEATAHEQTPWDQSSLRSQFYFNPEGEGEDALTEEDRELLLSLDPALRKKFEARFGLKIETVEENDDGVTEEMIATIVPAVTISAGSDDDADSDVAEADEKLEAAAVIPNLVISAADEEDWPGTPDIVRIPELRPAEPRESDVDVALLVPEAATQPVDRLAAAPDEPSAPVEEAEAPPAVDQQEPEATADALALEPAAPIAETEAAAIDEPEPESVADAAGQAAPTAEAEAPAEVAEAFVKEAPEADASAVEPAVPAAQAEATVVTEPEPDAIADAAVAEPAVAVERTEPEAVADSPAAEETDSGKRAVNSAVEPAVHVADAAAPVVTEPQAAADDLAGEPASPVAETAAVTGPPELEAVADTLVAEPAAAGANSDLPAFDSPEPKPEAIAQAPAAAPAVPVAGAEALAVDLPEPEAVADAPAAVPAAPLEVADVPAVGLAGSELDSVSTFEGSGGLAAEAAASVVTLPEPEPEALTEPSRPGSAVAEAEPTLPETAGTPPQDVAMADVPAARPAAPVAEAEAAAPEPEAVADPREPAPPVAAVPLTEPAETAPRDVAMTGPVEPAPEGRPEMPATNVPLPNVPEAQEEAAAMPVESLPGPEMIAMLEQPLRPALPETGGRDTTLLKSPAPIPNGSRALPVVGEEPGSFVGTQPNSAPDVPKLFPADGSTDKVDGPVPSLVPTPAVEPEQKLAAIDPSELQPKPVAPLPQPEEAAEVSEDMPRAIQEQLSRLGCYRSTIDGDWGPKSAKALLRYYATKKEAPDELDPNATLLAKLTQEETVVCARTENDRTVTRKKSGGDKDKAVSKPRKQAPAVARKPAGSKVVRTPAAKPKPQGGPKIATGEKKKKLTLGTGAFR